MRFPIGLSTSLAAYIVKNRLMREPFVPLVLMLEPLFACNLRCSTCGRVREYHDRASEMMGVEDCLQSSLECGAPVVSVCGGEPLIYPRIVELIEGLVAQRKWVYLCTNGVLLADSLKHFTPSPRLLFNIHIDGPPEVHDAVVESEGAYEAAAKGIALAHERGFQVTVNTTVCKQTDMGQIDALMDELTRIGVRTFMLSPAYSYESVEAKDCFMSRRDVHEKFAAIDTIARRHKLADTPIYLEYLKGLRELKCTAWGNPTRNPLGWRSPCYLIADHHYSSYRELVERTDWGRYGVGRDPRCQDCMVHCGFEPTAALMVNKRKGDLWKMIRWQFG
jgi:hopanoid biosynthesis associated radical SAM protein HpnH